MKVMVVDDERDVEVLFRQQFRKEIRSGALEMCCAFSGEEAISYLSSTQPPDIVYILSDINMPGMSGLDLLKTVKEKYPQIKVAMITAYGDEYNFQTAMTRGAEHYLTKPIDFGKIRGEVLGLSQ